ncbi:hypothetical protein P280DRAFT_392952, partial [Massarina eburnea CBS 473.64]
AVNMLGIDYESSDEEVVAPAKQPEVSPENTSSKGAIATNIELLKPTTASAPPKSAPIPTLSGNEPSQGPSIPDQAEDDGERDDAPPGSPYTSTRMAIQNLTLPTVPNWDIPPSPPGSPPQRATKKFTQFLELKKKGQHFNSRLETSSVLRDPNHLRKLYAFAEINEDDQYSSTLSEGLGVPAAWPEWAYGDALNASQKKIKASEPRQPASFVSARSAGESTGKRKELEYRGRREGGGSSKSGRQSRSRSPKRRRSQSRDRR